MKIAVSITDGRTVRDLLYNNFLAHLIESGAEVTIFTEAASVPKFIGEWQRPGIEFATLYPYDFTTPRSRAFWMRRRITRLGSPRLLRSWIKWEERKLYPPHPTYVKYLKDRRPNLIFTTNANHIAEEELISSAHSLGTPTLGFVRSWDNVHKGIRSRSRYLAVWNEINRQEVIDFEGYSDEDVYVVGAPQFDIYFAKDNIWSRERLAAHFGLDPTRPIILYATLGYFFPEFDETCWMDTIIELIKSGAIKKQPQVICRLHPWSRLEHFQRYTNHPYVRLSYVGHYLPALTWYMNREDVILMANMLRHSDVIITPASTVTLEAAIFDRPTIVPIFHKYQPERAKRYFSTWVLGKHFDRVNKLGLVPIINNLKDFAPAVNRCLEDSSWYRKERAKLVQDYAQFTDGRSTKRLVDLIIKLAAKN